MSYPSITDSQVLTIKRAAGGDDTAFSDLFHRHYEQVFNYAYWLCRDQALAADLSQDAFIRAHRSLDSLGPPWNFRAWIFRMTRNLFLDHQRSHKPVENLHADRPLPGDAPGPEGAVESRQQAERVRQVIQTLPDLYREALALREFGQYPYQDIADIMGISLSYVRVLLHRARAMFKERYGIRLLAEDPLPRCDVLNELLDGFHDQAPLTEHELARVEEHLETCATCQQRKRELVALSALFAWLPPLQPPGVGGESALQKPDQPPEPPQARSAKLPWLALVAIGILIAGLVGALFLLDGDLQRINTGMPVSPPAPDVDGRGGGQESDDPFCGDGVCQSEQEDARNCAADCLVDAVTLAPTASRPPFSNNSVEITAAPTVTTAGCADDGICTEAETAAGSCRDCSPNPLDQCGVACTGTCGSGLSCAGGVCWDAAVCGGDESGGGQTSGGPPGGGQSAVCGNGIVEAGEQCDGSNSTCSDPGTEYCTNSCTCEILQ